MGIGWVIPGTINSMVLVGLIPCMYVNWLLDENRCILTRLEHMCLVKDGFKIDYNKGFISTKLNSFDIQLSDKDIEKWLIGISLHTFFQAYRTIVTHLQI